MSSSSMKSVVDKFIGFFKTKSKEDNGKEDRKLKDIVEETTLQ